MKPNFALDLSHDGIGLLSRGRNGWLKVGGVALEDEALGSELAMLRRTATELAPGGITTKLLIPDSQILYTEIEAPGPDDAARREQIAAALVGRTPYDVRDLVFDWSGEGPAVQVAVVARETLNEAEGFAVEHRFNPVSFSARPGSDFEGEPFFGETGFAASFLNGERVEREATPVEIKGPLETADPATKPAASNEPQETAVTAEPDAGKGSLREAAEQDGAAQDTATAAAEGMLSSFVSSRAGQPATTADLTTRPSHVFGTGPAAKATSKGTPEQAPPPLAARIAPLPDLEKPARREKTATDSAKSGAKAKTSKAATKTAPPDAKSAKSAKAKSPIEVAGATPPTPGAQGAGATAAGPHLSPAETEAEALTIFGARSAQRGGARNRGALTLTLALLAILLGVAIWSSLYLGDKVARLFTPDNALDAATIAEMSQEAAEDAALAALPLAGTEAPLAVAPAPAVIDEPETAAVAVQTPDDEALADAELEAEPDLPADIASVAPEAELVTAALTPDEDVLAEPAVLPPGADSGIVTPEAEVVPAEPVVPTPAAAQSSYVATGIWQLPPAQAPDPDLGEPGVGELYLASIDPPIRSQDAIALPRAEAGTRDRRLAARTSPAAPGTRFDLDGRGLVRATPDGSLTPDGVRVFSGKPEVLPVARPDAGSEPALRIYDAADARFKPLTRPGDLIEQAERSRLGGLTRQELAQVRPLARPEDLAQKANPDVVPANAGSEWAIAVSVQPKARPENIAALAARAKRVPPSVQRTGPEVKKVSVPPTPQSVRRKATEKDKIALDEMSLVGVYGSSSSRRALVRMPSGRFIKVEVGDRVGGGRVAAIGDKSLRLIKSGKNVLLTMPKG